MGKRFSRYEFALEVIRTNNDPDTATIAPPNTPLEQYQKYTKGDFVPTYTRAEDSLPEKIETARIIPFGVTTTGASNYIVPFSKRAREEALNGIITACNHADAPDVTDVEAQGFTPAKAVIVVPGTGTEQEAESQITGRKYKKKPKRTFTYPYGKSTSNEFERNVRTVILQAALAANNDAKVTFSSERF